MSATSSYHFDLARSLVESCGYKEAIYFCQNNHWAGVLAAILHLYGTGPSQAL
ncbi:MAG: hypothetical protein ACFB6S_19575 [Geminicoccaceae bacterium]